MKIKEKSIVYIFAVFFSYVFKIVSVFHFMIWMTLFTKKKPTIFVCFFFFLSEANWPSRWWVWMSIHFTFYALSPPSSCVKSSISFFHFRLFFGFRFCCQFVHNFVTSCLCFFCFSSIVCLFKRKFPFVRLWDTCFSLKKMQLKQTICEWRANSVWFFFAFWINEICRMRFGLCMKKNICWIRIFIFWKNY